MTAFAERQLEKYGWKRGEGLGKESKGISKPVKTTLKQDRDGVGKSKEDFNFAWWDHVYNKASSNIVISADDEDGVKCATKENLKKEEIISTENPQTSQKAAISNKNSLLYGYFLSAGSDKQEANPVDYSSKMTDQEIFEACEGRRLGHRGGYQQVGKEKRLFLQETQGRFEEEKIEPKHKKPKIDSEKKKEKKKEKKGKKEKKKTSPTRK